MTSFDNPIAVIRDRLTDEIQQQMAILVATTNERRAGRIQGLQDALALVDSIYRQVVDSQTRSTETDN